MKFTPDFTDEHQTDLDPPDVEELKVWSICYHETGHAILMHVRGERDIVLSRNRTKDSEGYVHGYNLDHIIDDESNTLLVYGAIAGTLAEEALENPYYDIERLARSVRDRLVEWLDQQGDISFGEDIATAIELVRRNKPSQSSWSILQTIVTDYGSDCYTVLQYFRRELDQVASELFYTSNGVITPSRFQEISSSWKPFDVLQPNRMKTTAREIVEHICKERGFTDSPLSAPLGLQRLLSDLSPDSLGDLSRQLGLRHKHMRV